MKKLLVLLFVPLFWGCEKYELPSNPQLNLNGRWDVVDIKVVNKFNYGMDGVVVNSDRASVSNFFVIGVTPNNELLLTQGFDKILINRRFDVSTTQWSFENHYLNIRDDVSEEKMWVDLPCTYCKEQTIIETDYKGEKTRYTFEIDTYGAMPANKLVLTSQTFYTNIMVGGNEYDKAVESHLEITLHRY
jgi:hypothetical protein